MELIDTHTHLYYADSDDKIAQQIKHCQEKQVNKLFLPNVDSASASKLLNCCQTYPQQCFAMMGLHPCSVSHEPKVELKNIENIFKNKKIYAIGEVGLDYYHSKKYWAEQKEIFSLQIALATAYDLPLSIHCRESFDDVYHLLKKHQHPNLRGVLHCFTGSLQQAQKMIDMGFYLGIGGIVTYPKAGLDKTLSNININHIVLETDSPYLSPVPVRGKDNQSANLIYIANKVAEIYGISIEKTASITTTNALNLFIKKALI